MAGLLDIPAALMQIGKALEATAGRVDMARAALGRLETQAKKTAAATSAVTKAKGSPAGTMGASEGAGSGGAGGGQRASAASSWARPSSDTPRASMTARVSDTSATLTLTPERPVATSDRTSRAMTSASAPGSVAPTSSTPAWRCSVARGRPGRGGLNALARYDTRTGPGWSAMRVAMSRATGIVRSGRSTITRPASSNSRKASPATPSWARSTTPANSSTGVITSR